MIRICIPILNTIGLGFEATNFKLTSGINLISGDWYQVNNRKSIKETIAKQLKKGDKIIFLIPIHNRMKLILIPMFWWRLVQCLLYPQCRRLLKKQAVIKNPKHSTPKLLEYRNSAKLQNIKLIHRNLWLSYKLTMNWQEEKSRKQFCSQLHQKNKISRNKPNQGSERPIPWKL